METFAHYVVQPGDTVVCIAGRFHMEPEELLKLNPMLPKSGVVPPGLLLRLARDNSCTACQVESSEEALRKERAELPEPVAARAGRERILCPEPDYSYPQLCRDIALLQRRYPFIRCYDIGASVMGRRIQALRIGEGNTAIQINAAFHANEWITSLLAMAFVERYAHAYAEGELLSGADMRSLYSQTALWVVPMVNPDGVELVQAGVCHDHPRYDLLLEMNGGLTDFTGWKANVNGVDLNDQFPAHWEVEVLRREQPGPGPRDFPGYSPLSEPEAEAMYHFACSRGFEAVLALHTQGKEIYWNYRDYEPEDARERAERLGEACGYKAVKLEGSDAGYKDWFIQQFGRYGYTVEAGMGSNPLPIGQFDDIYAEVEKLLVAALSQ